MGIETSPNMLLLYGFDESGVSAVRANAGYLGSDYDLNVYQSSGTDGIPSVTDDRGGKAADLFSVRTGWTTALRYFKDENSILGSAHPAKPALPLTVATDDWAFGTRFQWGAGNTGGGANETEGVFGLEEDTFAANAYIWRISVLPNDATTPTAARINVRIGQESFDVYEDAAAFATTGSPGAYYIDPNLWYRVLVRVYFDTTGWRIKVYVYEESTGTLYTFDYTVAAAKATDYSAATLTNDFQVAAGMSSGGATTMLRGYADESWLYDAPLSDDDATSTVISGISIPWTEADYHREAHEVYSACAKENADYPPMRPLPAGATVARHPVDVLCQEIRCRVEGWKAGQPWALRAIDWIFDPAGPYGSHRARQGPRPDLSVGVWRTPGQKPYGAAEDSANVEYTANGPRRRRGFKIRRDVDSTGPDSSFCAFWTWRNYADSLFRLFKKGTTLYRDTGSEAVSLSTGWNGTEIPDAFFLDDRLVVLSATKQVMWDGGVSTQAFGAAAPASISVAAGSGGTLTGDYYYAVTLYDPTTGDETGPKISAQVSPAAQKVTITLPAAAPEARFTQYKIYRTADGGTAPNFFHILTETVAAAIDDTGEVDGIDLVDQVTDADGTFLAYITSVAPDTFAIGIAHQERAIYAKGGTNPERIYIAEPNEPIRFYADQWIPADGPVRALASWQGRVVVFTDNTVEIVESDFVRDANAQLNINRTVISRRVGAFGHAAVIVFQGRIFWMDRRGVFTLQGTEAVPVSERISDLFPYINTGLGDRIVGGWNHITRSLWWTLPLSNRQDDSSQMRTQFVMPLDAPEKFWFHNLEATYVGQFDDDLNGQRFGLIDHSGIFKELESYEGDGQQGNETGTFEDDDGISSIATNTITAKGAPAWTVDEHRGKGVVLRDVSTTKLYEYTIRSNTADTFTVDRTPNAALAADDGYYIGGFAAFLQLAAFDFGSPNRKAVRQVQYTFADLTKEDLYL